MIAFDTNLLIYAHREDVPQHAAARRVLERAIEEGRDCGIALPSVAEFWSVATHPLRGAAPDAIHRATVFLEMLFVEAEVALWLPHEGFWRRLARVAADLRIQGGRIFDLQIALIAFENGASEIWTHDRNFTRVPGLRVHDPL